MENTSSQREAQKSLVARGAGDDLISPVTNHKTFPRYMDLPFKIRKQIRTEAITVVRGNFRMEFRPEKACFPLALVSKEWMEDVEEALFGEIQINTLDEQEVSTFKKLFSTDRRKRFLTRLNFAIDDTKEAGPWRRKGGIVEIAHIMGTIGRFLQYINSWNFLREDGSQQTIEIVFVASHWKPIFHATTDTGLYLLFNSFWARADRKILTGNGLHPIKLLLKAIKSEFPSSLNMVKHIGFPPDFVPRRAAQKIIRKMPNLETCLLEPRFGTRSRKGWKYLTGIIHELRASAPSLRKLMLINPNPGDYMDDFSPNMIEFAAVLRDYSQGLESLCASPFELDREFFLPFSQRMMEVQFTRTTWKAHFDCCPVWRWLKHLDLQFFDDEGIDNYWNSDEDGSTEDDKEPRSASPTLDSEPNPWLPPGKTWLPTNKLCSEPKVPRDELRLSPTDILIAAGRAVIFMPVLRSARISVTSGHCILLKQKLPYPHGGPPTSRAFLTGCSAYEEEKILRTWSWSLGSVPTLDPNLKSEFWDPYVSADSDSDDSDSDDSSPDDSGPDNAGSGVSDAGVSSSDDSDSDDSDSDDSDSGDSGSGASGSNASGFDDPESDDDNGH